MHSSSTLLLKHLLCAGPGLASGMSQMIERLETGIYGTQERAMQ